MAAPRTSRTEFDALARRAGLQLSAAQSTELYAAWGTLETLIERLKTPYPSSAEPATIFAVDKSGGP
jgi:hypothetical protein